MSRLTKREGNSVRIGGLVLEKDEAWHKLAHYEDLEEQGRLIEQKQGTWENVETHVWESDCMWRCSECKEEFYFEYATPLESRTYYCPNCGAKMEEVE